MSSYGEITPIVGAVLRFAASVTSISGTPVNPDTFAISFRCQGQPVIGPFTYTFPSGDPSYEVVYTGTVGSFYCDYALPNAGVWAVSWNAQPSSGLDTTATSVIVEDEVTLSASAV
jgi:hypothetical protein